MSEKDNSGELSNKKIFLLFIFTLITVIGVLLIIVSLIPQETSKDISVGIIEDVELSVANQELNLTPENRDIDIVAVVTTPIVTKVNPEASVVTPNVTLNVSKGERSFVVGKPLDIQRMD